MRQSWRCCTIILFLTGMVSISYPPLFGAVASAGISAAAEYQDIRGIILDERSGETLPFAEVLLKDSRQGTSSNADGYFVLVDAPAKTCTLQVFYIGYAALELVIDNQKANSKPLKIRLKQTALEDKGVTVIAEEYQIWKTADEVAKLTLAPRQLSAIPNMGEIDIFRSLQLLPGISGVSDGSSGLYVRGGTPDQNLVLLDGMTVYHVDHFFGMFSAFNADAIKDVQVYKGGFPAKFGGRLSSVVELTGKTGDTSQKHFGFGLNLLSANGMMELPFFDGKGSFVLTARRSYTDIIKSSLYNKLFDFITSEESSGNAGPGRIGNGRRGQQFEATQPDFYFYDVNSKLSYTPTENDIFSFSFYNGKDNLAENQDLAGLRLLGSASAESGTRERDEATNWGNTGASLKWARRWHPRFNSTAILAASNYFSKHTTALNFSGLESDSGSVFRGRGAFASGEDNTINDLSFRLDNEFHVSNSHRIEFGTRISRTETKYTATINDSINVLDRRAASTQSTLFLQDKWSAGKNWDITYGLRGTYYDQTDELYFEPRFSMQYNLWNVLKFKTAWGKYQQYIHRIENEDVLEGSRDFWLVADENLSPGSAEHFIIGAAWETANYLFEIEAYQKNMDDLLEFSRRFQDRADYGGLFFFGEGVARGIEFLAQKKFGRLNGWISYTLGEVEHEFPNLNNGNPFPAGHHRTHELKTVGSYSIGNLSFSAAWVFASGQPYTTPVGQYNLDLLGSNSSSYIHVSEKNANRLPDYHRLDISAAYKFKNYSGFEYEFGASVFNVYDNTNIWYRKYDLDVTPVVITDVKMLGFTPTLFFKAHF